MKTVKEALAQVFVDFNCFNICHFFISLSLHVVPDKREVLEGLSGAKTSLLYCLWTRPCNNGVDQNPVSCNIKHSFVPKQCPSSTNYLWPKFNKKTGSHDRCNSGFDQTSWKTWAVAQLSPGTTCRREWCLFRFQGTRRSFGCSPVKRGRKEENCNSSSWRLGLAMIILKKGCTHKVFSCHTFIFIDKDLYPTINVVKKCMQWLQIGRFFEKKIVFKTAKSWIPEFLLNHTFGCHNNPRMPPWQIPTPLCMWRIRRSWMAVVLCWSLDSTVWGRKILKPTNDSGVKDTLQGTNISPKNGILKMIFLFPRWDMLIPWRVRMCFFFFGEEISPMPSRGEGLIISSGWGVALGRYPALDDHECFNFWIPPLLCFLSLLLMPADYDDSWWFYMYICRFCMILFRITHTQAFT